MADHIQPSQQLILTEGEFDTLTTWQIGWGKLSVTSIDCASNQHTNLRWYDKLLTAARLLVCMYADEAGEKAATQLASLSHAVKRVQVPVGKDMNEFYRLAGNQAVQNWLKTQLGQ